MAHTEIDQSIAYTTEISLLRALAMWQGFHDIINKLEKDNKSASHFK